MFRNLFLIGVFVFGLNSCSKSFIEKTNSYRDKYEFKSKNKEHQNIEEDKEVESQKPETLSITMSLQDKLDAYAEIAKSKIAPAHKKVMIESLQRLKNQQMEAKFPKTGDRADNFELVDNKGNKVELYELLKEKNVVLLFYRGSWCPYCNLELKEFKNYYQAFKNAGLEVIAISPEKPSYSEVFNNKNSLPFPLLFDDHNKVAKKYHLNFTLDPQLVPIYKQFGIDIGERNGNGEWEIPVPATFIISKDKSIKYVFADVDYKHRAEPDSVLALAKTRLN
jgi:peroxiredoxin